MSVLNRIPDHLMGRQVYQPRKMEDIMNIRNCRVCGRIFNYLSGAPVCQACKESQETKFQEVKEYIREHRGVGIQEVADACDVEPGQIRQWLREDRLEVTEDSAVFLNCESCGAPIRSGKFCERCKANMTKGFNEVLKTNQPEPKPQKLGSDEQSARMRFLQ